LQPCAAANNILIHETPSEFIRADKTLSSYTIIELPDWQVFCSSEDKSAE
jgi:hypothetical protein